jgi:hypothetical protein
VTISIDVGAFNIKILLLKIAYLKKTIKSIKCKGYLLYKCPEEHRFQAAGNERKNSN